MATDLIVSFLSSVPPEVAARFQKPPALLAVPGAPLGQGRTFYASWLSGVRDGAGNVVPGMFARAGGKGDIGRVAVIGFSNGVDAGVSQVLEANDAQKIDFVGAFDGIHGSFVKNPATGNPIKDPKSGLPVMVAAAYNKWIAYGRMAAQKRPSSDPQSPQLVITHSSIEPPFPSTTETANLIWAEILKTTPADYEATYWSELDKIVYPGGLSFKSIDTASTGQPMPSWTWESFADGWYDRRVANGLSIFGWGDPGVSPEKRIQASCRDKFNCTADHLFQAKGVLPAILTVYLAARWNGACGPVSGLGDGTVCTTGDGRPYDAGPSGPLPTPVALPLPSLPVACPYPSPGQVLVGSKADPCATESAPLPLHAPPSKSPLPSGANLLAAALGLGAGYGLTRYVQQRSRRT
jgi:hypothetical protein